MNLHLLYTYFDGFEQLKESLEEMIDHVDNVSICYQVRSNKGEKRPETHSEIKYLLNKYPTIKILFYVPDFQVSPNENERRKHDMMIQFAKREGASHFILSACDHVYSPDHIAYAKRRMIDEDLDLCITSMFTYYKNKTWRLDPPESYFMPFIHKMYSDTRIEEKAYPVVCDPSVTVNTSEKLRIFDQDNCVLHHYSMIREDMEMKFRNSAASGNWTPEEVEIFIKEWNEAKIGDSITYYSGRKLVETC